jgi:apolipoprotein D and lipocalin family protein
MYGRWYLVATVRQKGFEEGMVAPYDEYSKRKDGDIQDDFYVRRGSFGAALKHYSLHSWVRPGTNNAHWRTQLFWPVDVPFLALYTDPQYRYVLFGEQNRKMGWIYSRAQTLPDADYNFLLDRFQALGYDRTQFVKFVQQPDQIGKPGFWSEKIR